MLPIVSLAEGNEVAVKDSTRVKKHSLHIMEFRSDTTKFQKQFWKKYGYNRFIISTNIGTPPTPSAIPDNSWDSSVYMDYSTPAIQYRDYDMDFNLGHIVYSINLEYRATLFHGIRVTAGMWKDRVQAIDRYTNNTLFTINNNCLSFSAQYIAHWWNSPYASAYSGLGVSYTRVESHNDHKQINKTEFTTIITPNITFFGIKAGRRLFGFCELIGISHHGAFRAGIGYGLIKR